MPSALTLRWRCWQRPPYFDYHQQSHGESTDYTCDNPYQLLREITPQHVISRSHTGGLVGFLGFDSVNFLSRPWIFKPVMISEPFKFGVYLDGLSLDKMTGEIFIIITIPTTKAIVLTKSSHYWTLFRLIYPAHCWAFGRWDEPRATCGSGDESQRRH